MKETRKTEPGAVADVREIPTPAFVIYEDRLRRNLELLKNVSEAARLKIIMAFKANALWKNFPIIREYFQSSTASSLNEMQLSLDYLGGDVHAYCTVYTDETFPRFLAGCSHITFNSLAQFRRFHPQIAEHNSQLSTLNSTLYTLHSTLVSAGLRVNPQCSVIETDIYNPCVPGSRFGVDAQTLRREVGDTLPEGIEGLHFHALCESGSEDLEKVLTAFREQFGQYLGQVKWLNMGGGHLITRKGYDIERLVSLIDGLHADYPDLEVIIEPGSAFTWRTGDLLTSVLDIVENSGVKTAIIDASFACHMPDTLEMPYKPFITEALPDRPADRLSDLPTDRPQDAVAPYAVVPYAVAPYAVAPYETSGGYGGTASRGRDIKEHTFEYRLGGNSCLSGDYVGTWLFAKPLEVGQRLTLEDMNHYTTVKTTMFNGLQHPDIWFVPSQGEPQLLRRFTYDDYRDRMC